MGAGPVQALAKTESDKITRAEKDVQKYASSSTPTKEYEPIIVEKTQVLTKDVNKAWKELYERQAPLLTWPEQVQARRFRKWGRKWPDNTDPRKVYYAIIDYVEAYPNYVKMVYQTCNPFNYETGEGVVEAGPEEQ